MYWGVRVSQRKIKGVVMGVRVTERKIKRGLRSTEMKVKGSRTVRNRIYCFGVKVT